MFDTVLTWSSPSNRSGKLLPFSIAVHGLAIGALVAVSFSRVEESPEATLPIVFEQPPGPPPLQGDPAGLPSPPRRSNVRLVHLPFLQPTHPNIPPEESPLPSQLEIGETGMDTQEVGSEGRRDGVQNGIGKEDGGRGREISPERFDPGDPTLIAPQLLLRVEPSYPETARKGHIEGLVILEAEISVSGSVEDVRIIRPANPLLDEAARRAVGQWRYRPAMRHGRTVAVLLSVTVAFKLR